MTSRSGCAWLGRDAASGIALSQPPVDSVSGERLRALTASPRHYGLHATLKPPFRLAAGTTDEMLVGAVSELAARMPSFTLPPIARVDEATLMPMRAHPLGDEVLFDCDLSGQRLPVGVAKRSR